MKRDDGRQVMDCKSDYSDPNGFPDAWEMRQPGLERLSDRSKPNRSTLNYKEKRERKKYRRSLRERSNS